MLKISFLTVFLVIILQKEVKSFSNFDFKIETIHKLISSGEKNCTEIVQFFQIRINKYNPLINAIVSQNPNALQQAAELDNFFVINKNFKGSLHCIPLAVKDNIDISGIPTTGGIKALKDSIPKKNALVIDRLLAQGAIILFKTNLGELAYGNRISELVGECMNPFDSKRSCGPSSFGSGASISAGLSVISIGTDTSGSILYPGSYNGIFSFRPALNSTPLDGIIPLFEKADTVGPFAKHLDDLVTTLSVMADNASIKQEYSNNISYDQLKIGVVSNLVNNFDLNFLNTQKFGSIYRIDPEVKQAFENTIYRFKILGIPVKEFSLNMTEFEDLFKKLDDIFDSYVNCLIGSKKQSMNFYFSDDQRFGPDSPIKTFDEFFSSELLNDYWREDFNVSQIVSNDPNIKSECDNFVLKSKMINKLISSWYDMHNLDCFIVPTSTSLPKLNVQIEEDIFLDSTIIIGILAGFPILNLPVGFSKKKLDASDGLPIGLSLISKPDRLIKVLKISQAYEKNFGLTKLPSRMPLINLSNKAIQLRQLSVYILIFFFFKLQLD